YLGVHEVTQKQYETVMGKNPSHFTGDTSRPVESVSWADAVDFCKKLAERPEEKRLGRGYRLPTEAEGEYACRPPGRENLLPPFYCPSASLTLEAANANFDGNFPYPQGRLEKGPWLQKTLPVGSYPPNARGLHDMHGNVSEWCSDWYDRDYYKEGPHRDSP